MYKVVRVCMSQNDQPSPAYDELKRQAFEFMLMKSFTKLESSHCSKPNTASLTDVIAKDSQQSENKITALTCNIMPRQ